MSLILNPRPLLDITLQHYLKYSWHYSVCRKQMGERNCLTEKEMSVSRIEIMTVVMNNITDSSVRPPHNQTVW